MRPRRERARRGGFSLIELMMAIGILLVSSLAVGFALHAGMRTTREIREEQVLQATAQTFIDRIVRQNYGQTYDPDPTGSQVSAIFDAGSPPGDITVQQLTRWPAGDGGWKFTLANYPVVGEWRVVVGQDLDGNGAVSGTLEEGQRVLAIRVFFEGALILETSRAKEVTL